ncbi:diacylglycerol/lipid kinase family protein [Lentibacillus sediminis]|uniref:diacylglycerol/lipid kinase family protein n=1 Tax=Lentibacillus sediminis TaxID=1940529 RepID=UPI000C1C24EA|nr:diacylglycerol kinase family protein [Lentibacillus sediminis]
MVVFIVNPSAGNGRAARIFTNIQKSSRYQDLYCRTFYTEYEGHAEKIAASLSRQPYELKAVIVVAGDGTLHEVMNGLGTQEIPLGFIPGGSGNDFARGCGLKGKPDVLLEKILGSEEESLWWPGAYQHDDNRERLFANSIGFGFDAEVTMKANQAGYKRVFNRLGIGKVSYAIALIQVLFTFRPMDLVLEINGQPRFLHQCWMVTIGNHPYFGGGMKILPEARMQKDKVDTLILHSISKWKVLGVFLTVFAGKHTVFREVETLKAERVRLAADQPISFQVDGQPASCRTATVGKPTQPVKIAGAGGGPLKEKTPKQPHQNTYL